MSEVQVEAFINTVLKDLSSSAGVETPKWEWRMILGLIAFSNKRKVIEIRKFLIVNAWQVNVERTKSTLRCLLAHEFYHYLISIGERFGQWHGLSVERDADIFAMGYSGVSKDELAIIRKELLNPEHVATWR